MLAAGHEPLSRRGMNMAADAHATNRHAASEAPRSGVRVHAPARLHLGFLDPGQHLGRRFGSIGLTIDAFPIEVLARRRPGARDHLVSGDADGAALRFLERTLAALGPVGTAAGALSLAVQARTPRHAGLGSGTQLGLAVAAAVHRLLGQPTDPSSLAAATGRGLRSGIGAAAFAQGGFVVDGGSRADARRAAVPPVLSRMPFPEAWRVLLILDADRHGLHGDDEIAAFRDLPALSREAVAHICHLTLLQLLPALAERDFAPFAAGIGEIQAIVGDHFAPAQGGRFASPAVAGELAWLAGHGCTGLGQTSWGPTGFCLFDSEDALARASAARGTPDAGLRWVACRGLNEGARITSQQEPVATGPQQGAGDHGNPAASQPTTRHR